MMRGRMIALVAATASGVALATTAQAAPLGPVPLSSPDNGVKVEKVYDGCGWGRHANGYGECVLNRALRRDLYGPPRGYYGGYYRPRPVYRPYGYYARRPYY